MKKIIMVLGILLLSGFIAYPIFAQQFYKMGRGPGMMGGDWGNGARCGSGPLNWKNNLTKEQLQQIEDLNKKFQEQTQPTRTELRAKQAELFAALSAVKPDQNKALAVQKEISELQAKLAQERVKVLLELRKINPDAGLGRWSMRGGRQGRIGMMGGMGGPCGGPGANDDND